jgi:hypothetical protein
MCTKVLYTAMGNREPSVAGLVYAIAAVPYNRASWRDQ